MKREKITENTTTTFVELIRSSRVGQMTLVNSARTSLIKVLIFSHIPVSQSQTYIIRLRLSNVAAS